MTYNKMRFSVLIGLVTISGFSQGMLLPLLAIILEQNGVSSAVNGLHATGLYIGVLIASPFMEKPLQKLGFKPIILIGGLLVIISMVLFPFWNALWFWFILRMTVGIGDHMLHFATQTWVTTTVKKETRGRSIALYGLAFGLGFAIGPLMTRLLSINEALPFIVSAILSLIVWSFMFLIKNDWPEEDLESVQVTNTFGRFKEAAKLSWIALLAPLGYGFLEATLHGIFPIYGMRIGHDFNTLALIIPCFAAASLITQIPLGALSDKIGRRKTLLCVIGIGFFSFLTAALLETSIPALFIIFTLAGMCVGSLYSLGISFMTDLLPTRLLPAGNILCGISFSLGSISGPYLGGLFIQHFPSLSFFYVIAMMLLILFGIILYKREGYSARII